MLNIGNGNVKDKLTSCQGSGRSPVRESGLDDGGRRHPSRDIPIVPSTWDELAPSPEGLEVRLS